MESAREGCFTKIGVLIAAIGVAVTWYYDRRAESIHAQRYAALPSSSKIESPLTKAAAPPMPPSVLPVDSTKPEKGESRPPGDFSHRTKPASPLFFTLHDGEQQVFLGGQASVAAEFNQVGSEEFATLRVGTIGGDSIPHAILNAGARFPVRIAGGNYSVCVLSVDKSARTVRVQINRNPDAPEGGGQ